MPACAIAYPAIRQIWKKRTHPFHTDGAPPRMGSTSRATINSNWNIRKAPVKIATVKSATRVRGAAKVLYLSVAEPGSLVASGFSILRTSSAADTAC